MANPVSRWTQPTVQPPPTKERRDTFGRCALGIVASHLQRLDGYPDERVKFLMDIARLADTKPNGASS